MRAAEEELLARVREALGAKHVIRVCSSYDQARMAGNHGATPRQGLLTVLCQQLMPDFHLRSCHCGKKIKKNEKEKEKMRFMQSEPHAHV